VGRGEGVSQVIDPDWTLILDSLENLSSIHGIRGLDYRTHVWIRPEIVTEGILCVTVFM